MAAIATVDAGTTRKGARRAQQILNAALEEIVETGYADLSLNAVARRVGISQGNLQYYFPTRSHLLQAAFAEQIERHKKRWIAVYRQPAANPRERLKNLIALELDANRDTKFVAQVRERWSLAERDRELRRLSNESHRWATGRYAKLINEIRPDLDKRRCRQLSLVVYAVMIGTAPYFGPEAAVPGMSSGLDDVIETTIFNTIEMAERRTDHKGRQHR